MIQGAHEQRQREGGGGAPKNIVKAMDAGCAIFNLGECGDKIGLDESLTNELPHESDAYEQYYGGWLGATRMGQDWYQQWQGALR